MTHPGGVVASLALAALVDGPRRWLRVVHRTTLVWQLSDDDGRCVACLTFPGSLRLPHAFCSQPPPAAGDTLVVGDGGLSWPDHDLRVARWYRPARPRWPALRHRIDPTAALAVVAGWCDELGRGDGLTPYTDDVLCGALVTLLAAGHPLGDTLAGEITAADLEARTTASSAGLLRQAAHGRCLDEVAAVIAASATGAGLEAAERRLLAVGHSSGRGLLAGINAMLPTQPGSAVA